MQLIYKMLIAGAVSAAAARTAAGQRGAPPGRGGSGSPGAKQRVQTPARDTTKKAASAGMLDFEDQDLKVVLNAIAAAGNLNVSLANIPAERATVHLGQAVPRDSMVVILRAIAEAHSLKFTPSPTLIQIAGPPPQPVQRGPTAQELLAQQFAQSNQQQAIRLFTYRLRHASAIQLAPVLTNLFQGASSGFNVGRGGTTLIPNGNGGFTTITTPGGNIQTIPP